ncbi:VOC family protein [Geothrix sp. 21YS21S-4]|uniref:bleomycin resistance protein n=1 Tax=Geothrix sp. 21YS21S-4 TaxID=3068889 RepID=UPI0027BA2C61|nr:VOC family protein [Geothrix sp. 21YS21S-4]
MFQVAVPLLHVSNARKAEAFYCGGLGFRKASSSAADGADPCYLALERDGVWLHLSSHAGDGVAGSAVNLFVEDVDALRAEFAGRGLPIPLEPTDQTWGNREMYLRDPDGNSVRFLTPKRS